jgi:hypothetical protein
LSLNNKQPPRSVGPGLTAAPRRCSSILPHGVELLLKLGHGLQMPAGQSR